MNECPSRHARQASVVDPETDEVVWVCQDCGADCTADVR